MGDRGFPNCSLQTSPPNTLQQPCEALMDPVYMDTQKCHGPACVCRDSSDQELCHPSLETLRLEGNLVHHYPSLLPSSPRQGIKLTPGTSLPTRSEDFYHITQARLYLWVFCSILTAQIEVTKDIQIVSLPLPLPFSLGNTAFEEHANCPFRFPASGKYICFHYLISAIFVQ